MKLISVYEERVSAIALYYLLEEREPWQSISHRSMPTMAEHERFIASVPYLGWYLIEEAESYVGACYLTRQREIGIGIFRKHRRRGYAKQAVQMLMELHAGGDFLANINPQNTPSLQMFESMGFALVPQVTLRKESHVAS